MFSKLSILMAAGLVLIPISAAAQVAEIRVGIAEFDERTFRIQGADTFGRANENSVSISGEILFEEPEFLKWALSPQPYVGGSLNLEGNTSFAGAGLLWRQTLGKKFYADYAFGLVGHTGTTTIEPSAELISLLQQADGFDSIDDIPDNLLDTLDVAFADLAEQQDEEIEFGSRILFRLQGAIGYNLNEDWAGEFYVEHLSNGSVFSNEANEGVNILGIRAARKF